ncbi:putative cbd9-like protein [Rosellinia necatrix]|uniref:Putative cbd9-like protein n=1 Tax=Rosellinia necatrix TaxID=77044 RepID=A0A1W2TSQ5_ROSNE|nr:putative cbd9-like protein [Rosellinia necatrix]
MRWNLGLAYVAALLGCASEGLAADTSVVRDGETGFTFAEYRASFVIGQYITFRVAVPTPAPANYDIVFQIISPMAVGWTGLSWGASMINCPLTIGWASGSSLVGSVRRTNVRTAPQLYDGAKLQVLKTGTKVNGTHWQITAKCSGCSSFTSTGSNVKTLNPNGSNRLAFAYSKTRPSSASSAAMITVHDTFSYWDHDFATAGNIDFDQLVVRNT